MSYESGPWIGDSGQEYLFHVFPIDADVSPRTGIFIYCKKNPENLWVPVFIGEGNLAERCTDSHTLECIRSKQATHVHLRLNKRAEDRAEELSDLLRRYKNTFSPEGCNSPETQPAEPFTASDVAP